jgi:hypothetical protein
MSGKNAIRKHQGEISKEKSLPESTEENWNKRIPLYWSGPTIWAQASIEASLKIDNIRFLKDFNYAKMFAYCFAFTSSQYYNRIFRVILSEFTFFERIKLFYLILFHFTSISFIRLNSLMNKFKKSNNELVFDSIEEVILHLNMHNKDVNFGKFLK